MNKSRWIPALLLAAVVAAPALAGSDCSKCTENTQACLDAMVAKLQHRGWVGIELDKDDHGKLTVTDVIPESPAQRAGLRAGDVLFAVNGVEFGQKNKKELHAVKKKLPLTPSCPTHQPSTVAPKQHRSSLVASLSSRMSMR